MGYRVVNSGLIADGTVGTVDIADCAVTCAKIAGGAVTGAKIAAEAVVGGHVATGAIGGWHIAEGAIEDCHISEAHSTFCFPECVDVDFQADVHAYGTVSMYSDVCVSGLADFSVASGLLLPADGPCCDGALRWCGYDGKVQFYCCDGWYCLEIAW